MNQSPSSLSNSAKSARRLLFAGEYQLGPYVAGPKYVLIPYASLRALLAPGSVLQPFL